MEPTFLQRILITSMEMILRKRCRISLEWRLAVTAATMMPFPSTPWPLDIALLHTTTNAGRTSILDMVVERKCS
jgi:hypothetical protein